MASRKQRDFNVINHQWLAKGKRLKGSGAVCTIAMLHDVDGLGRGQDMLMTRAGMVGVTMRNDGPAYRLPHRVDIAIDRVYIEFMVEPLHDDTYRDLSARLQSHPLTGWLQGRGWDWFDHQIQTADSALEGRDTILFAPTGAGKTLADSCHLSRSCGSGLIWQASHALYLAAQGAGR